MYVYVEGYLIDQDKVWMTEVVKIWVQPHSIFFESVQSEKPVPCAGFLHRTKEPCWVSKQGRRQGNGHRN